MEVRVRAFAEEPKYGYEENLGYQQQKMTDLKSQSRIWRRIKHEAIEMTRVTVNMLKGNGSKLSYLFIPAFISLFWLGICFITTRNPNVTLEDQYIRVRPYIKDNKGKQTAEIIFTSYIYYLS